MFLCIFDRANAWALSTDSSTKPVRAFTVVLYPTFELPSAHEDTATPRKRGLYNTVGIFIDSKTAKIYIKCSKRITCFFSYCHDCPLEFRNLLFQITPRFWARDPCRQQIFQASSSLMDAAMETALVGKGKDLNNFIGSTWALTCCKWQRPTGHVCHSRWNQTISSVVAAWVPRQLCLVRTSRGFNIHHWKKWQGMKSYDYTRTHTHIYIVLYNYIYN